MRTAFAALGVLFLGAFSASTYSQSNNITLSGDSRPIMSAAMALTAKYGYVITYEDPKYVDPDDVKDVTPDHYIPPKMRGKVRVLIPRGGDLQLPLPTGEKLSQQGMYSLLQTLVSTWTDSNQGGAHFEVTEEGPIFHIAPIEVRDRNGNWQLVQSVMDKPISFPAQPRLRSKTYEMICAEIASGVATNVYCLPDGGFVEGPTESVKYTIGAQDEPAGSVLSRAIKMMDTKGGWYLNYDPTMRAYVLNIIRQPVPPPSRAPMPPIPPNPPGVCGIACGGTPLPK